MPAPFSILAIDLHNTIYDEVMEYGFAIEEAVLAWVELAKKRGGLLTAETVYRELASAHRKLGSDWDGEVWQHLPSLTRLHLSDAEFAKAMNEAETRRRKKSLQLVVSGQYDGVVQTLTTLRQRGIRIYVITEASADTAMNAVTWLKLIGVVDGVYSYPSRKAPPVFRNTYHKPFPSSAHGKHLKKPHPYLLAVLVLDEAIRSGGITAHTTMDDVFGVDEDETFSIPDLSASARIDNGIGIRLVLKNTPHAEVLRRTLNAVLYVGDSKFKDGLLAQSAGVAFGFAAYGKKVKSGDEGRHRKSLGVMYAVTGWDEDVIKLTQEASRSGTVNRLNPDFTFENSLSEALDLFTSA